jgi:hypothetical protein
MRRERGKVLAILGMTFSVNELRFGNEIANKFLLKGWVSIGVCFLWEGSLEVCGKVQKMHSFGEKRG